jgi:hypothetical protein
MSENKKELTTMERAFLEHLFGAAQGNFKQAMSLAGYGDNTSTSQIRRQLKDEIIEAAKLYLSGAMVKAIFATEDVLDSPNQLGAANKIKAANSILDRAGMTAPTGDVKLNVGSGGLIILPAKGGVKIDPNEDGVDA